MNPKDLLGKRLFGEYRIVDHLGAGAIGSVYLARQEKIDKKIAVKVLHERSATDEETVKRFEREALAISLLTHPNIIRVLIFGRTEEGLLYLAMEYVEGKTLNSLAEAERVDELRIIKIFKQLCSALSEAHQMGIVHRDLKPDNILLTSWRGEDDFVKILDFGIAKFTDVDEDEKRRRISQSGIVYGTPAYVSPEQAQALNLDHRSDIYSLGCILFEMLTGKLPFECKTAVQMLGAHVATPVAAPSKVVSGVSAAMDRIVMKAMAKEPEDRFQDAMEMYAALEKREEEIAVEEGRKTLSSPAALEVSGVKGGSNQGGATAVGKEGGLSLSSADATKLLIGAGVGATVMFIVMLFLGGLIWMMGR